MDREDVIKGLEQIVNDPFVKARADYWALVCSEALALLKEQEAVALKPHYIDKYGKNFICGVECGNCGVEISATYKFCPYCGRSVKRE